MVEDFSEHRRSVRVTHHFMARYLVPGRTPKQWLVSPLRDLSSGGARFLSDHPFTVKDEFELQLVLPRVPEPVALKAVVAWIRPGPMGMQELGVSFDPGDTAIQAIIDTAVARFAEKERLSDKGDRE